MKGFGIIFLVFLFVICSCQVPSNSTKIDSVSNDNINAAKVIRAYSDLPIASISNSGLLFYVITDSQFYYSNSVKWVPIDLRGPSGKDGVSMKWLGTFAIVPVLPALNNAYYDSTQKKSYIWDGSGWQVIASDGAQGPQGPVGPTGATGPSGSTGSNGTPGVTGYYDSFNRTDLGSSWTMYSPAGNYQVSNGKFQITGTNSAYRASAYFLGASIQNFRLSIDTTFVSGENYSPYGIFFRNGISFCLQQNKHFSISRNSTSLAFQYCDDIAIDTKIVVEAVANNIDFYIAGKKVYTISDDAPQSSSIELFASVIQTPISPMNSVQFDNFTLTTYQIQTVQ